MSKESTPFPGDIAVRIPSEDLPRLHDDLERNGMACIDAPLQGCDDKASLMDCLAKAARYPDLQAFGANWDALSDMLMDLGWWPAAGYGLVMDLRGFDTTTHHGLLATLADVLRDVRAFWQSQDVAFVPFCIID